MHLGRKVLIKKKKKKLSRKLSRNSHGMLYLVTYQKSMSLASIVQNIFRQYINIDERL